MGGLGFAGNQVTDIDDLAASVGVVLDGYFGAGSGPKSLLEQSIGMDPGIVILTRTPPRVGPTGMTEDQLQVFGDQVPDEVALTVGDVFGTYYDMTDAEQRDYQDRLFAAGMYSSGTDPADIGRDDKTISAIKNAIEHEGNRGRNPLDIQAPDGFEMPTPPEPRGYTAAQLDAFADGAARKVLGRGATSGERALAVEAWRGVEGSALGSPVADMEAALRREGGSEARKFALGDTLRSFMNIVAAR